MSPQPAGPKDAARLAAIHAQAFPRPWSEEEFAALLAQDGAFALTIGEPFQAFILCRVIAGEGEILTLTAARLGRRRGLGRALVAAAR